MEKKLFLSILLVFLFLAPAIFAFNLETQQNASITNDDILKMLSVKLGENVIIMRIEKGPCKFDLSPEALISLNKGGATNQIIEVMIKAASVPANTGSQENDSVLSGKAVTISVPTYSVRTEKVKVSIGSDKALKGELYNDGGYVYFESKEKTSKWLATELLAKYERSWHASTPSYAGSKGWEVSESLISTLTNGEVVSFSFNRDCAWWGPPLLNTLMIAAASQFLQSRIASYQPSGGRTEDTLTFRVLHVQESGFIGLGKIHFCTGKLSVSLRTGKVIFEDGEDSKQSFELLPSDAWGVSGVAFVESTISEYFFTPKIREEYGVDTERFKNSSEFFISGKKINGMFVFNSDDKIDGVLAPASLVEYIVKAFTRPK